MSKAQGLLGRVARRNPVVGSVVSGVVAYWFVTEILSYQGDEWVAVGLLAVISYLVLTDE